MLLCSSITVTLLVQWFVRFLRRPWNSLRSNKKPRRLWLSKTAVQDSRALEWKATHLWVSWCLQLTTLCLGSVARAPATICARWENCSYQFVGLVLLPHVSTGAKCLAQRHVIVSIGWCPPHALLQHMWESFGSTYCRICLRQAP